MPEEELIKWMTKVKEKFGAWGEAWAVLLYPICQGLDDCDLDQWMEKVEQKVGETCQKS